MRITPSRIIQSLMIPALAAVFSTTSVLAEQVIFTEIHYNAKAGQPDFLEITNNTATPLDMGKWYFSNGINYTFPDFNPGAPNDHILKHFETILVSPVDEATLRAAYPNIPAATRIFGPYTGALSNSGETLTLSDKNGVILTTIEYNDGGKWPAAADGTGHTLTRINPNRSNAEWRNWMSSEVPGGTPGITPANAGDLPTTTTQVAEIDSVWKYDQNEANVDRGTTWREPGFDDSTWTEGPGLFGKDTGDSFATPWTTGGRATYYLRRNFQFNSSFSTATIDINAHIDDGLVVYLNGNEIARFNMPSGEINFDTVAISQREWDELAEIVSDFDITSNLQVGSNVLAVEVHNANPFSNDIGFGADIQINSTEPPFGPLPNLVISEIHFGAEGNIDWVELHAPGNSPVSAAGLKLSPTRSLTNTVDLTGTIPAGGYVSFPVTLPIDANGDVDLFLVQGATVIDAARLDRDLGEESFQSYPVGEEWYGGMGNTRDAPNNPSSRQTAIVINEIMYDAPSDQGTAEFIELYNRGTETVDLSGWRISDGVRFDFPLGTTIAPGGYLVIAADLDCLTAAHGAIPAIGNWQGGLRDGGELLRIEDQNGNLVDEVDYLPEGDWPNLADGDGSSMELRHPDMDNNVGTAWADSDESQKSTIQTFTYTADFERAPWLPVTSGQELHTHLVGDAHLILENISVTLNNAGPNLLQNSGVMSPDNLSSKGWVCQGTHWQSFMDGGKLNLISTGHGDNKANRGEVDFATSPTVGQSYTLSFDGRWVSGKSRIIFQTLDHGFGTTFLLPIPENLGTPGAANSAAIASAAPTVTDIIHSPAVPSAGDSVTVSARVDSATALTAVDLVHRLDNSNGNGTWVRTPMSNDGNGLFKATVTQNTSEFQITQFYVEATAGTATTTQPRFGPDRPAMWIVDSRPMPENLLRNRFIFSAYDARALTVSVGHSPAFAYNFPRMSNQFFNATFIANEKEIFYNAEIRKSGSPFTRADDPNIDHGKWKLPGDRLFRGRRRNVIDASGTPEGSGTPRFYDDRVARYFLYQLGHPVSEMEFTYTVVNNNTFKRRENHEPISNDFLDRNFEDGNEGTLLRIDDKWRFTSDDGNARSSLNADWSYKGTQNPIAYHSEWLMRTRESDYDYGNFVELTRLISEGKTDEVTLNRITDTNLLALNATVRGYDADWDTITVDRGKNAYFFRPKEGKGWMLLHWDGDRVFERTSQAILGNRIGVSTYFNRPFIRRQMNYYMTKLLNEHTKGSARTAAWFQAEENSVANTGISVSTGHYTNWFNNRESLARNFITSSVANTAFAVTTPSTTTTDDLITLTGTSPPTALEIQVVGQTGTTMRWLSNTTWEISRIVLKQGVNVLDVEGLDHDGNVTAQTQFTITKTDNAPPIVLVESSPRSRNLALGETLFLNFSGSSDPDGENVIYNWSVLPTQGANFLVDQGAVTANFTRPGFYVFTVQASDGSANTTTKSIGVSVYQANDFSNFSAPSLESFWTGFKASKHANSSDGAHYTLQDHAGRLTINIPLSKVQLGLPAPVLPPPSNYVDFGSVWKYDDTGQELTGTFAQPAFDDSTWSSGPGFLGFGAIGTNGPPAPGFQTSNLQSGFVTYYFRTEFEFNGDPIGATLSIDQLVDDGVRYYLNGQVLGSIRLPAGQINSNTTAEGLSSSLEDVIEEDILVLDVSGAIVAGTNVFAAEVHNFAAANSDLVFGARVDIAANPIIEGPPSLDAAPHPWIRRVLPADDWTLATEVQLEKVQFGGFFTGLLVEAEQGGNAFRYGVAMKDGESIAAIRVNPSGTVETLASIPALGLTTAGLRIERQGDLLNFYVSEDPSLNLIHQITLPEGTTFSVGGVFASTEIEQSLEASFDYVMLINSSSDFSSWMAANGFTDPNAEFGSTGLSNILAYALGRDLSPMVEPTLVREGNVIGFTHRQRILDGQLSYQVESSTNLVDWEIASDLTPDGAPEINADGTFTINLLSNLPASTRNKVFYRLKILLP